MVRRGGAHLAEQIGFGQVLRDDGVELSIQLAHTPESDAAYRNHDGADQQKGSIQLMREFDIIQEMPVCGEMGVECIHRASSPRKL